MDQVDLTRRATTGLHRQAATTCTSFCPAQVLLQPSYSSVVPSSFPTSSLPSSAAFPHRTTPAPKPFTVCTLSSSPGPSATGSGAGASGGVRCPSAACTCFLAFGPEGRCHSSIDGDHYRPRGSTTHGNRQTDRRTGSQSSQEHQRGSEPQVTSSLPEGPPHNKLCRVHKRCVSLLRRSFTPTQDHLH